ncbi:unnamed protein product [Amoebophrya sp. A25]|nr:unnamed protein product [Amoebophrya sp. A25]|eukprot:GSA25T00018648001.1
MLYYYYIITEVDVNVIRLHRLKKIVLAAALLHLLLKTLFLMYWLFYVLFDAW